MLFKIYCFCYLSPMLAIFLDSEASGLDPTRHAVLDIAFKIVNINTNKILVSYNRLVKVSRETWEKHDPHSLEINGITWDMLQEGGVEPSIIGKEIIEIFQTHGVQRGKAEFICQNPAFDRSYFNQLVDVYIQDKLSWPYHWLDFASMYWMYTYQKTRQQGVPFPETISLSKNDIAKEFQIPPEEDPHRAINGVKHLIQCYEALFQVKFS